MRANPNWSQKYGSNHEGGGLTPSCQIINYRKLAEFCLGALGWSPKTFWQDAILQDISYAMEGYAIYQLSMAEKSADLPSTEFLMEMVERFPDAKNL